MTDHETVKDFIESIRKPKSPGDPIKHHYIPRFILRGFSSDEHIMSLRLSGSSKVISTSINDAATISNFYTTIADDIGETVMVEKLLAEIEEETAPIIECLRRETRFPLNANDRASIAAWVAIQLVRGPVFRLKLQSMFEFAAKQELGSLTDIQVARQYLTKREIAPTNELVNDTVSFAKHIQDFTFVPHQNDLIKMMLELGGPLIDRLCTYGYSMIKFEKPGLLLPDQGICQSEWVFMRAAGIQEKEFFIPIDRRTILVAHSPRLKEDIFFEGPELQQRINAIAASNSLDCVFTHKDDVNLLNDFEFGGRNMAFFNINFGGELPMHTAGINSSIGRRQMVRFTHPVWEPTNE